MKGKLSRIKLRILSSILAMIIASGGILQIPVCAASPSTETQNETRKETGRESGNESRKESVKELTGLKITDLEEPVAGKELDPIATVRTDEQVTWEIPVIWVDEDGKVATIAQPGKTYYPTFVFYIPEGYKINSISSVKLPDFLMAVYGTDRLVFVADPAKGITYIAWNVDFSGTAAKNQKILSMNSMQSVTAQDVKDGVTYLAVMENNLSILKDALN